MPFKLQRRHLLLSVVSMALGLALLMGFHYHRLLERGWFNLRHTFNASQDQTLELASYRAAIQGKKIGDLANVSALTFDPQRNTLFTVTNKQSELVELSLEGDIVRRIDLVGFGDPEGVEYVRPGTLVISDERDQRLLVVRIDDETTTLNADDAQQIVLGLGGRRNRGFEGLAYDRVQERLFVANEQSPMAIFEINGFADGGDAEPIEITRDEDIFVTDLSSLEYDQRHDHLLALSEQSKLLLELGDHHKPVGTLSLRRGFHGLKQTVPQAEGVALDDDGTIYLVSEPNLFYVFKKPATSE
jgi:uncharacterized protein YjiK